MVNFAFSVINNTTTSEHKQQQQHQQQQQHLRQKTTGKIYITITGIYYTHTL